MGTIILNMIIFSKLYNRFLEEPLNENERLVIEFLQEADVPGKMSPKLLHFLCNRFMDEDTEETTIDGLIDKGKIAYVSATFKYQEVPYEFDHFELL